MYFERLKSVLRKCLKLGLVFGIVTVDLLAEELGVGERILREYLRDLTVLGVLEYLGGGRYRVNVDRIDVVSRFLEGRELKITDFFDEDLLRSIGTSHEIGERVNRIFSKLNLDYLLDPDFRDRVRDYRVSSTTKIDGARIIGDRLIFSGVSRKFLLDGVYIGGSGYDYSVVNQILMSGVGEPFAVLTLAFISSAACIAYFSGNVLDDSRSKILVRPDFRHYGGRSPFVRGEPFYELVTDYPELLDFARRLAARLIAQRIHYEVIIDAIESSGGDIDVFFIGGTLFPHGYVIKAKKLIMLKRKIEALFEELVSKAKKYGILLAGVNFRPHDNVFVRALREFFGVSAGYINDTNALIFLLDEGDTTTLINRFAERGRGRLDEWYEFYMKAEGHIVKVEFISLGEPVKEYIKIRDYLYSSFIPSPRGDLLYGPSPMVTSVIRARDRLKVLRDSVVNIIRFRFDEYLDRFVW